MPEQDQEVIREFLIESHENLSRLDQRMVDLEKDPRNQALLAEIFRTFHTIKGTCGFFGFATLERITHQAENLLSQLRDGQRDLSPALVSLILETVDATRKILAFVEAGGNEGTEAFEDLTGRLKAFAQSSNSPAAPSSAAKPEPESAKASSLADSNIRVAVGLLDKLMDLVGELVLTRNQILQFNAEREDAALNTTSQRLNLITTELQEGVMKTRMQPIGMVWNKLPRVVRDMAVSLGKQIRLEMEGTGTELDRTIIEAIKDPLVHLVRNACDHGIEPAEARVRAGKPAEGTLTLRAFHEGGQVNIEIGDDGAGVDIARVKQKAIEKGHLSAEQAARLSDREALNLIFQPGLSTAKTITSVSGRGVGMDVVRSNVEKIGGTVDLSSRAGEGSTVRLKIPLTLAIIPGLVVTSGNCRSHPRTGASGGERFVIPQVSLVELIRLEDQASRTQIEHIHGTPVYRRRGSLLPLAHLTEVLGLERAPCNVVNIVVLQAEERQFGLVVDGISDTQEIVVKPLGKQLKGLNIYAGATIMGDGKVSLILDVTGISQRAGIFAESREARSADLDKDQRELLTSENSQRLLLFRAGSFERLAVPLSMVARLEEFAGSLIEHAGGRQVVQYRGRILPLIPLGDVLDGGDSAQPSPHTADPVQVVVFNDAGRSVGLIVDQILDITQEAVTVRQKTGRKGLLGSGVVGKRVADFLDLNFVLHAAAADWFQSKPSAASGKRVLLAEPSSFSRGLIRSGLDMAGYCVTEAASLEDVLRGLDGQKVDLVVAALDLPPGGSSELLAALRRKPEWSPIPLLVLAESADQLPGAAAQGFEDCQVKFDREAMLESVARLACALASTEAIPETRSS